jgi:hypothetical protein
MHAPVVSGTILLSGRELLDAALQKSRHELELDRDVFVRVYLGEYKPRFQDFCRNGKLPPLVIAFCQALVRGEIS